MPLKHKCVLVMQGIQKFSKGTEHKILQEISLKEATEAATKQCLENNKKKLFIKKLMRPTFYCFKIKRSNYDT